MLLKKKKKRLTSRKFPPYLPHRNFCQICVNLLFYVFSSENKIRRNKKNSYFVTLNLRRWITPTNENPDNDNDGHVIDENRLLLVAPPGCPFVEVCCQFLRLLHK